MCRPNELQVMKSSFHTRKNDSSKIKISTGPYPLRNDWNNSTSINPISARRLHSNQGSASGSANTPNSGRKLPIDTKSEPRRRILIKGSTDYTPNTLASSKSRAEVRGLLLDEERNPSSEGEEKLRLNSRFCKSKRSKSTLDINDIEMIEESSLPSSQTFRMRSENESSKGSRVNSSSQKRRGYIASQTSLNLDSLTVSDDPIKISSKAELEHAKSKLLLQNHEIESLHESISSLKNELKTIREDERRRRMEDNKEIMTQLALQEKEIKSWAEKYEVNEGILNAEREEMEKFKNDLLLVVRAANDLKAEAEGKCIQLQNENVLLQQKIIALEKELLEKEAAGRIRQIESKEESEIGGNRTHGQIQADDSQLMTVQNGQSELDSNKENISSTVQNEISNNNQPSTFIETSQIVQFNRINQHSNDAIQTSFRSHLSSTNNSEESKSKLILERDDSDPLSALVKIGGSRRNALLKWCQSRTTGYKNMDITNFSTSWENGMALCALLHSLLPEKIPYESLKSENRVQNFELAFRVAQSSGIVTKCWNPLNSNDNQDTPAWEQVMNYVKEVFIHLGRGKN